MSTLSESSASTQDPAPPGSWPLSTQEDGSDLPSQSLATEPQPTDSLPSQSQPTDSIPSSSTPKYEPPFRRTESKGLNTGPRKARPHRGRYEPRHPDYRLTREQLREIADVTIFKLDSGFYVPPPFKSRAQAEEEAKLKAIEEAEAEAREREKEKEMEKEQAESQSVPDAEATEATSNVKPSLEGQDQDGEQGQPPETEGSDELKGEEEKGESEPIYSYAYDLVSKMEYTNTQTEFYASDDPFISNWPLIASGNTESNEGASEAEPGSAEPSSETKTRILIREYSTLVGARRLHDLNCRKRSKDAGRGDSGNDNDRIGVLNFASAKKPGGGFLSGAQAQEESLARTSTLFPSLISPIASPFYEHYQENQRSPTIAYYTHAMIYSPSVVLFRNDKGLWMSPVEVDILTSAAVNAGEVRERVRYEEELREVKERWEKFAAERKRAVEEQRKKEEEEWEAVLKDNEEMKKRYGDGELGQPGVDDGSTIENPPADKPVEEVTKDLTDIPSGTSDALLTPGTKTVSSIQVDDHPHKETPPSPGQEKDKELQESTAPVAADSTDSTSAPEAPEPVDTPGEPKPDPMALAEIEIEAQMQERIARILALFAARRRPSGTENLPTTTNNQPRTPHLILGSFGTGVFQNHVPLVARIFYDLIARRGAPFAGVFNTVVFAILGTETVNVFREVFAGRSGVAQDGVLDVEELLEMDGRVEVVLEGEDEDESELEMEEEVGCEEEGVLKVVKEATADQEIVSNVEDGGGDEDKGQDGSDVPVNIEVDEVQAEAAEIEMRDGTHDSDQSTERGFNGNGGHGDVGSDSDDADVEMLDTADDVHIHPRELIDVEPTSVPTSA